MAYPSGGRRLRGFDLLRRIAGYCWILTMPSRLAATAARRGSGAPASMVLLLAPAVTAGAAVTAGGSWSGQRPVTGILSAHAGLPGGLDRGHRLADPHRDALSLYVRRLGHQDLEQTIPCRGLDLPRLDVAGQGDRAAERAVAAL